MFWEQSAGKRRNLKFIVFILSEAKQSMDFAQGTNMQRSFALLRMTVLVPNSQKDYRVLLNSGIAMPSVTAAKMERNSMSPQTAERVVSFSSRHLKPSTA